MLARSRSVQPWPSWLNSYPCPIGRTAICSATSADGRHACRTKSPSGRCAAARSVALENGNFVAVFGPAGQLIQKPEPSGGAGAPAKGRTVHALRPPERPGEPIHSSPSARAADPKPSHGPIRAPSCRPSRGHLYRSLPWPDRQLCCKTATRRPTGRELLGSQGAWAGRESAWHDVAAHSRASHGRVARTAGRARGPCLRQGCATTRTCP
jgi:hypothetical protein